MPPEFDMQKARDACENLPKYMVGACPSKEEARAAGMLPAALDEIERQIKLVDSYRSQNIRYHQEKEQLGKDVIVANQRYLDLQQICDDQAKRIAELEELDECLMCGRHLFRADPVLGKDLVYRLGTIFFDPGSPGGREEPPEPACAIPICQDCLEDLEKVDLLKEKIAKQRAALKKLGKRSGKRGKALVEERAKCIMLIEKLEVVANNLDWKERGLSKKLDDYQQIARQQLRSEGKL